MGGIIVSALLFGVYIKAPDFWKLSYNPLVRSFDLGSYGLCLNLMVGMVSQRAVGGSG